MRIFSAKAQCTLPPMEMDTNFCNEIVDRIINYMSCATYKLDRSKKNSGMSCCRASGGEGRR